MPREQKKGCFITTAVCEFRGLPDNCAELECLRDFRDGYMQSFRQGRDMVAEYYAVAPAIAGEMTPQQKKQAWTTIQRAVDAIRNDDALLALALYMGMVRDLGGGGKDL